MLQVIRDGAGKSGGASAMRGLAVGRVIAPDGDLSKVFDEAYQAFRRSYPGIKAIQ